MGEVGVWSDFEQKVLEVRKAGTSVSWRGDIMSISEIGRVQKTRVPIALPLFRGLKLNISVALDTRSLESPSHCLYSED